MRNLLADYVAEAPDLMPFYARPPRALFASLPKTPPWDPELAAAVADYNERIGGHAVFTGDEAAIVTGQQAGLLTGPLYTIYKAATAVLLARKLQARSGRLCAPVFWVASEDHDFEEVRTVHLLAKTHELATLRYEPSAPASGMPVSRVPAEASLHALIDDTASKAAGSEHRDSIASFLHESLDASASFAEWTARIIARLFRDTPLILFEPHLPPARTLAQPIVEHAIREPLLVSRLVNEAGERLEDLGYPRAIVKGGNECAFFLDEDGCRIKVTFEDGCFRLADKDRAYGMDEMLAMAAAEPGRFSGNVALRCLVQQRLFPVAAYVAGPGELAYWGQFKALFESFGLDMPVVYPRAQCVLSTLKLNRLLAKLGIERDELAGSPEGLAETVLRRTADETAGNIVARHRQAMMDAWRQFADELAPYSPAAAAMARKTAERAANDIERIERALQQGDVARATAIREQIARLCTAFFPLRKPQERVLNIFSFLFEHGWELIPRLLKEIDIETFAPKEIEL
ncbi:MAG TPA: bacillithiol biosynthesis cysteine-adding enzyme BshC [Candidatus Hydrogenedentes bacterium]|nr:bacillithiol biosynthesis cysteine-adding enzyme BshC [Candidatus Hydrogenedentota bacterium]